MRGRRGAGAKHPETGPIRVAALSRGGRGCAAARVLCGPCVELLVAGGLVWAVLVGCRTPPHLGTLDLSEPGWRVQLGQAIWCPKAGLPALAGELMVASHPDHRWFVQFSKTPFPFVTARGEARQWTIEYPPQRLVFRGQGSPPARFGWLHLVSALDGRPLPEPWQFLRQADNHWRLDAPGSGESIEGFLNP